MGGSRFEIEERDKMCCRDMPGSERSWGVEIPTGLRTATRVEDWTFLTLKNCEALWAYDIGLAGLAVCVCRVLV